MKECWNDDKNSRPTFLELKEAFDGLIAYEERYNYLRLDGDRAEDEEVAPQLTVECSDPGLALEGVVLAAQPIKGSASGQEAVVTIVESAC